MTINLQIPAKTEHLRPTITVIGVGGAGGNAVNNMISANLEGVNFVVANTDAQALDNSLTERTIQLGANITKGLGAGAKPEVGKAAAEEASDEIAAYVEGSNMVFITAGMGGGTGTGAAAVVAKIAKEQGMLTVAVVTKPFQFEGSQRMRQAEEGLKALQEHVDTLIVIPNQNLFRIANEKTTFADAFKMADEVLHSGVRGVTDLMVKPGLINLDFSDIRTVMLEMGKAMMGTGESTGERRAIEAAEAAISNPLLDDVSLKGARALLVNVTGGLDMTLFEVDEALNRIREEVDADANIIFGSTFNEAMEGKMRVSVVATGIDAQSFKQANSSVAGNSVASVSSQKPAIANAVSEIKKPYSFGGAVNTKPEPIKATPRFAPVENSRPQFEVKPVAMRMSGDDLSADSNSFAGEEFVQPSAVTPAKETSFSPTVQERPLFQHQPAARVTGNRETVSVNIDEGLDGQHKEKSGIARNLFKKIADVGRSISRSHDEETEEDEQPRVQVVQRTAQTVASGKSSKVQDEDQYLDIPAFLRRQAN